MSFRLFMSSAGAAGQPETPRSLILSNDALFYLWSGEQSSWALALPPSEVALLFATHGQFIKVVDFIHVAEAWTAARLFARALGQIQACEDAAGRGKAVEQFRRAMAMHGLKQTSEGMAMHLLDVAGGRPRTNAP